MKISRNWLSDFVDLVEKDPQVIADQLTRRMGEVDDIVEQGALMKDCVVGKVLTLEKHPNADKLSVCTVETDKGIKTVVCGGSNVKIGMLAAFAHSGAQVKWHGGELMTLTKVKIRGVESDGMICAQEELGMTGFDPKPEDGERPIVDLTAKGFKPGTPLKEALGLDDVTFHIDNHAITNRPDLFSHIGVARELVAMGLAKWKKQPTRKKFTFPKDALPFKSKNAIPELVPRYCACALSIDSAGVTPDWMKKKLEATGWRSINLPVDITNYVAMETGMPLHCFDIDDLQGEVVIRTSKKGDKLVTLDEVERSLPDGAIVISDDKGIFDLLGIMGGLRSSTKSTSKRLYLHAAIVDPVSIRRAIIATAHRTDASTVYEKGVPRCTAETGFFRALELFMELVPGAKIISKMEDEGKDPPKKPITLKADMISSVIGEEIKPAEMKRILTDLGFEVKTTASTLTVTPPPWRSDMNFKQDVIEEVARIYGYANIKPIMPEASTVPPARNTVLDTIRDNLKESRYVELLHLAFVSPALLAKSGMDATHVLAIENPLGEETSRMRTSLLPAMLETAGRELKKVASQLKVYEAGHIFTKTTETGELTLLVAARGKTTVKDEPFLVAKRDILMALASAGLNATVQPTKATLPPYAHAGRSADIVVSGTVIGLLTELHPVIRQTFDLTGRAAVAMIDWEKVQTLKPDVTLSKPIPGFPSIERDETLPLTPNWKHGDKVQKIRALDTLIESVDVADMYEGTTGKTITLHFVYRAKDRTLTEAEVEALHSRVLAELKK